MHHLLLAELPSARLIARCRPPCPACRLGVRDILRDIVSLYGTADAGVIGNETPLSVAIRRWLAAHPEAAAELFGAQRLPTLVQYDPFSRLLEKHPDDGGCRVQQGGLLWGAWQGCWRGGSVCEASIMMRGRLVGDTCQLASLPLNPGLGTMLAMHVCRAPPDGCRHPGCVLSCHASHRSAPAPVLHRGRWRHPIILRWGAGLWAWRHVHEADAPAAVFQSAVFHSARPSRLLPAHSPH